MLNALRNLAKTWVARVLIVLLVVSFGAWGISDAVNSADPTELGRAGDVVVSIAEFQRAYEATRFNISQQQRRGTSVQEDRIIASQVAQSLLADALQVDAARRLGVDVSDEAIAERIRANETFAGPNGFEAARYRQFLQRSRTTERDYIAQQRAEATQELFVNSLVGGVTAPTPYIEAINRYVNQTRTVETVALTDAALDAIPDPSEETLRAYYSANVAEFRSPERRTFSVLSLSPEALADPAAVAEDQVRRAYEAEGAYGAPERRTVEQVFTTERAAAETAAAAINAGTAFAEAVAPLGQAPVSLGSVAKEDILNPEVAEAAFSLEAGGASVVVTRFGPALVHVSAIDASNKQPFEDVEAEIRNALALDEAVDQVRALETDVTDAVAGGDRVADVAARFELPVATVAGVDRSGAAADGSRPDVPGGSEVLSSAFAQAPGSDAAEVRVGDVDHWVEVSAAEPPADRPFEEVEDLVRAAWTQSEKRVRLDALAAEALALLQAGTPAAEVAARYGVEAATSAPFSQGAPPEQLAAEVVSAAFEGPAGHVGMVPGAAGTVLFKVTSVEEPAFFEEAADLSGIKANLDEGVGNAILFDVMNAWQREVGVTLNQPLVEAVVSGQPVAR